MRSRHFRVLDVEVQLTGPGEIVDPIAFAYRRFAAPSAEAAADGASRALRLEHPDPTRLIVDGVAADLIPGLDRTAQVYQGLQIALMKAIASHAVLHAAAMVDPAGGVVILAAPSGHGKSSVTLELVRRGYRFMSDDYAPLDPVQRTIAPYPRAVGVIPGGTAPIPEAFRTAAVAPDAVRLLGKTLVDVGDTLGEQTVADEPAPLRHVVLLTSSLDTATGAAETSILLAGRNEHAGEFEALFRSTPGVTIAAKERGEHLATWRLDLDPAERPTERLSELLDGDRIVFAEKYWDGRPDFGSTPAVEPIRRRRAAELLGRELLNRRSGGALLARYGNSVPRLFLDVAGALREAACYKLKVGNYAATADLIQQSVATGSRGLR